MDLREILFAQFPAFFLLSLLFLIAHLRVRKHSAVKSVLWVLLFGAALAELKFWSWLGLVIVVFVFVLRLVFKLQNKHAQHMVEKERAKAEKTREEAVKQAREEGRAEAMAAQQAQEAEAAAAEPAADESASPAAEEPAPAENADPEKAVER